MDEQAARWEVSSTLSLKGFKYIGPGADRYRGSIMAGHKRVDVDIEIPDLSFAQLPKIEFVDPSALPLSLVAHLEQGSGLCYADRTLLRLDQFNPGASILRVLEEAEKTILKSLSGRAAQEIALEFPAYWRGTRVQILFPKESGVKEAHIAMSPFASDKEMLVATTQKLPSDYIQGGVVHFVRSKKALVPAESFIAPRTLGDLEHWHSCQAISVGDRFEVVLRLLAQGNAVFYSAPNGWVGCRLKLPPNLKYLVDNKKIRPAFLHDQLILRKDAIEVDRYYGVEASLDYITTRNFQSRMVSLKDKRISLIGCGTIGSHLARFLVQSGVGNNSPFLLIDNQELTAGNLGRHLLNFSDIGRPKAVALAAELSRFHPEVKTVGINSDAKAAWPRIARSDLIIDATGAEMVSDFLNMTALSERNAGQSTNLFHVWLVGNGIAAQTFLNIGGAYACYRCLRPDLGVPWLNDPRKDVKDIGEIMPGTCGDGPFVPFGVEASVMAASLALSAIVEYFTGTPGARLRTLVIDPDRANRLTDKSPLPHANCPACQQHSAS
jgi:molybdopterin/thiamine biosynthesis adenylyltransferase